MVYTISEEPQQTAAAVHEPLAELTLALLPPLLESQSSVDSSLIRTTVQAMINFLKSLSPQGLKVL